MRVVFFFAIVGCFGLAGAAPAAPPRPLSALVADLNALAPLAGTHDPEVVQSRYDRARDLEEELSAGEPSLACRALADVLRLAARGHVIASEGFDRLSSALRQRGERQVRVVGHDISTAASSCPPSGHLSRATAGTESMLEPLDREAFFGTVRARVPRGAASIELRWRGRQVGPPHPVLGPLFTTQLRAVASGKGTLELRFRDRSGDVIATTRATSAWLLPVSGDAAPPAESRQRDLERRLAVIAQGFPGHSGLYVLDLRTGQAGGWNEEARFPAASTVKLGVLASALARYGPRPERSATFYDMRTLAAWSSNLGANRLLRLLGHGDLYRGRALVEERLRRMGATRSTYPGEYRVGTSVARRGAAPDEPPLVSQRTTTARDLGRMLATIHAAAAGDPGSVRASGLSRHEARVALSLLLDSQASGDNIGLFRPWLPRTLPAAQKQGWISTARHTAAIVYTQRGPVVVICLTYAESLGLPTAQGLGRSVLAVAGVVPR
jgi:beta-lactamase class A